MQSRGFIRGVHYCFIVDDIGIASSFPQIKLRLTERGHHHVSLVYTDPANLFVFRKELDLLEKIFSLQFMVFHELISATSLIAQETIESILNANVMEKIRFIISGREEFVRKVEAQLLFLGIKEIEIQEQLFT